MTPPSEPTQPSPTRQITWIAFRARARLNHRGHDSHDWGPSCSPDSGRVWVHHHLLVPGRPLPTTTPQKRGGLVTFLQHPLQFLPIPIHIGIPIEHKITAVSLRLGGDREWWMGNGSATGGALTPTRLLFLRRSLLPPIGLVRNSSFGIAQPEIFRPLWMAPQTRESVTPNPHIIATGGAGYRRAKPSPGSPTQGEQQQQAADAGKVHHIRETEWEDEDETVRESKLIAPLVSTSFRGASSEMTHESRDATPGSPTLLEQRSVSCQAPP
jgi:hypothetical protein